MIRKLLVPVRGDGKGDNVLAHAAGLAARFKAHVTITHCRARPEDMIPYGVPIPAFLKTQIQEQATQIADLEEKGLQEELKVLAASLNLDMANGPSKNAATASWIEEEGRQVDVIKRHGRLADLICVAKPDVDRNLGTNTLKAALFNTGRPVMMCPEATEDLSGLGSQVAIAWNGSTEAARAVALTLGLIEAADNVTILTSGSEVHGASTADLVTYLNLRDVNADILRFDAKKKVGQKLLERSKACGADLMIMGAYGDSHEKEVIFGGNTQYIVDNGDMPVVLVH